MNKKAAVVLVAVLITALVGVWSLNLVTQIVRDKGQIQRAAASLGDLDHVAYLVYLNEIMTSSARLAAETGKFPWRDRYQKASGETDALFRELLASNLKNVSQFLDQSLQARKVFTEIEKGAFEMIRSGELSEARVLLRGPEYEKQKGIYADSLRHALNEQKTQIESELNRLFIAQRHRFYQLYVLAVIFLATAMIAVMLLIQRNQLEKERQQAQQELHHAQKVEALGRMAAGVIHEIKNPLAVIMGLADANLIQGGISATFEKDLKTMKEAGLRCEKFIQSLLRFSHKEEEFVKEPVDLKELMEETLDLVKGKFKDSGIQLDPRLEQVPRISGDVEQIRQVLVNLLLNAADACENAHNPRVTVRLHAATQGACIIVADNGPGVPENIRKKIFDPFFTTKPKGKGTGLGLSVCQGIINRHKGKISVENGAQGGANFIVELPAV